jgi:arabinose-5-phosphate isomerase
LKRLQNKLISFCGDMDSTLSQASDVALDCAVTEEACPLGLAPTASTTVMLALGDALAMEVSRRKGFRLEDFAALHPGGGLGRRLARVRHLMAKGDSVPRVDAKTPMPQVIYEMSRRGLGMTTVVEGAKLLGIISDGDLRRLLEQVGGNALEKTAGEVMNPVPRTIAPDAFAAEALGILEERKITSLVVVDSDGVVEGVLHLHALWGTELI